MKDFKRGLYAGIGFLVIVLPFILGIGIATIFHKACDGKNCINFNGPLISEIDGKTYKYGEECY
jgi:hypothetical protein